jgi:hypothetical protein
MGDCKIIGGAVEEGIDIGGGLLLGSFAILSTLKELAHETVSP